MTDLAVRRLLAHGVGGSHAQIELDADQSTALDDRPSRRRAWRSPRKWRLLSLTPFAVPIVEMVFARGYVSGLIATPPDIVGAPLGLVLELALLGWAAVGAALVWHARSVQLAQFGVIVFTPTAIVGLIFRPAVVLLMANLPV